MSEQEWLSIFADNLIWLLKYKNTSKYDLSSLANVSKGSISKIIRKKQIPNIFSLINLANALDEDLDEFLYFDEVIK